MENFTILQHTIALYCDDLMKQLELHPALRFNRKGFSEAVQRAKDLEYDELLVRELCMHAMNTADSIMSVFSRNPDMLNFEKYYMRAQSIIDMCRNIMNESI